MYGSGFGFGSEKSKLFHRLMKFKKENLPYQKNEHQLAANFRIEFSAELANQHKRVVLMLALMDASLPASAALDFYKKFENTGDEQHNFTTAGFAWAAKPVTLDQAQHEFPKTLQDWMGDYRDTLRTKNPLRYLTADIFFLGLSILACSGGSFDKDARILAGYDAIEIREMTKEESPIGRVLGFSGATWLMLLFWMSEGKMWQGCSSKACNYILTGVIVALGAFTALPSGVVSNVGFESNFLDLFDFEPPQWMLEYDVAMAANTLMNARLAVANLHNLLVGGEIIVRSISSTEGWYKVLLIFQLILMLFISVLCNYAFVQYGTEVPVVKDFDSETKKIVSSVFLNIPQFMLLMMTLMFNSPYSAWRQNIGWFAHFCMLFMILGGLMDGVLAKMALDKGEMSEPVKLFLSWGVTVAATAGFMSMGPVLARKFRETYYNIRALCCCCGACRCCRGGGDGYAHITASSYERDPLLRDA